MDDDESHACSMQQNNIVNNFHYESVSYPPLGSTSLKNNFTAENAQSLVLGSNTPALNQDQTIPPNFDRIRKMLGVSKVSDYTNPTEFWHHAANDETGGSSLTANSLLSSVSSIDSLRALTEMSNTLNREIESIAASHALQATDRFDSTDSNHPGLAINEYLGAESSCNDRTLTKSLAVSRLQNLEDSDDFSQSTVKLELKQDLSFDVFGKGTNETREKNCFEPSVIVEQIPPCSSDAIGSIENIRNTGNFTGDRNRGVQQNSENSDSFGEPLVKLEVTPDLPYDVSEMDESETANCESETELNGNETLENSQQESLESACDQSSNSSESNSNFGSCFGKKTKGSTQRSSSSNGEASEGSAKPRGTHVDVNRPFKCEICAKSFQKRAYLLNHQNIHDDECKNECKFCRKRFPTANNLEMHVRTHTGIKPFECDVCQKTFIRSDRLQTHMRMHSGIKPFRCDLCEKTFFNANSLKIHARMHTGEKPYECDICEKQFVRADRLQTHLRTHTGEKPFTCDHCGKNFNRADILKTHLRTHTGEKPFVCEVCEKKFTQLSTLKGHMLIHTGEKPYECEICERRFREMSTLRGHYQTHRNR